MPRELGSSSSSLCNWQRQCILLGRAICERSAAGCSCRCVREVARGEARMPQRKQGQRTMPPAPGRSCWCCRSRCSAGPTAGTGIKLTTQCGQQQLARQQATGSRRLREERLLAAMAPLRIQDITECAARALSSQESRWHLARRAGGHPTNPGAWIELMHVAARLSLNRVRRSLLALVSLKSDFSTRPGLSPLYQSPSANVDDAPPILALPFHHSPSCPRPRQEGFPRAASFGLLCLPAQLFLPTWSATN